MRTTPRCDSSSSVRRTSGPRSESSSSSRESAWIVAPRPYPSDVARTAFGDEVVAHYLNAADVELAAFGAAVTDWERVRGFERL